MTKPRPQKRRSPLMKPLCLLLLCTLTLQGSLQTTFAQGLRPLVLPQKPSQPCAANDELCRLRVAVSAALDEIARLKSQAKTAEEAIVALREQAAAAEAALAANKAEREAHERTLAIAEKAIGQQQQIIATYEGAIKTLTTLVELTMKRVDTLERKLDKANGRTAILGIVLTVAGVIVGLKR